MIGTWSDWPAAVLVTVHCDQCGKVWSIGHRAMGDLHLGFIKGLDRPYALARAVGDARIQREWPGPVVSREDYYAGVEAMAPACECGGAFRYGAEPRCPTCRSTSEQWTKCRTLMYPDSYVLRLTSNRHIGHTKSPPCLSG